jgi:hypothetical protein
VTGKDGTVEVGRPTVMCVLDAVFRMDRIPDAPLRR